MRVKNYDQKSYDLAEAFLEDEPKLNTEANRDDLAKDIQRAIEDWFFMNSGERPQSSSRPDLSTVEKRNAFYNSEEYRNMTTAEKCGTQGDAFLNDYD